MGHRYSVSGVAQPYDSGISFAPCPEGQIPISGSGYMWPASGDYYTGSPLFVEISPDTGSDNNVAVSLPEGRTAAMSVQVIGFCAEVQN